MFRYAAFALTIDSEIELPELPAGDGEPEVVIRLGEVSPVHRYATNEQVFANRRGLAKFLIRGGTEIIVDPVPGGDPALLRIWLMGRVMAYLLRQRGWLPLHASGVLIAGKAVLFVGPSGSGKSTTAAAFHARGYSVIADDVGGVGVVEGSCHVRPAISQLRLLEDSRPVLESVDSGHRYQLDKYVIDLGAGILRCSLPLTRIYVLEFGERLGIEEIPRIPAMTILSENTILSRRGLHHEVVAVHLRQCASIIAKMRVHRLVRPKSLRKISELVSLVEKDVSSHSAI